MNKAFITFLVLLFPIMSFSKTEAPKEKPEKEPQKKCEDFEPWYTGPLIAGSANNLYPRQTNIQPYVFYGHSDKVFQRHKGHRKTDDVKTLQFVQLFQRGLLNWLDFSVSLGESYSKQKSHEAWTFADMIAYFGIQLLRQQDHTPIPSLRLIAGEKFPTGKYQKLNSTKGGIDAGGNGSYETHVGLYVSKTIFFKPCHPVSFRLNFVQTFGTTVKVHGFHAFGGGFGTNGKVRVPKETIAIFAFEYSITQRWVAACDFAYFYSSPPHFRGTKGTTLTGGVAKNDTGLSDYLMIAPALEYNINSYSGIIGGVRFTAYGRNSQDRIDGVLSYTVTF